MKRNVIYAGCIFEDNDPSENMSLNEARMEYARMKNSM